MNFANVIIADTNIALYEYSKNIWDSYGIKSERVDNIEQALEKLTVYKYHLIVIVECKEQRQYVLDSINLFRELTLAPIVIASTDPIDHKYSITAYDLGIDEVWEMPEHIEEAVAKGNAIIRRYLELNKKITKHSTIIVNNRIIISVAQRLVFVKGNKVDLPNIEFDILALLIAQPGKVFTYEYIFKEIWGNEFVDNNKDILRNHIYKLREKLKVNSTIPNYIKRHHGIGYSFMPEYDEL